MFSAGDFIGDDSTEDIVFKDAARHIYKKLVIKNNMLIGIVLYGETTDGLWYFSLLTEGQDISEIRENIIFGQHHIDAPRD